MPSTYTGSGIELIAPGEQSGTWNLTTNLNLQVIDRMTSQAGTISLSGTSHTLTVSDGVLSDGQYGVLVFAGSPSGANTVTISPNTAQRTFIARNTTAQSVVLTQGSGGDVTIPASTTKIVFSDGGGLTAAVVDVTALLASDVQGNVTGNVTGNAGTATTLQTARTIGGVSFDGSANINLPGVNQAGNQSTTGNAATATKWATARNLTINGVAKSVDGTANVAFTGPEVGSVPSGGIIMWSGAIVNIPTGWLLCDGTNGTPDLRNRFVAGAGSTYAVGATGGADTVTLTSAQIPGHTHTFSGTTNTVGDHTHSLPQGSGSTGAVAVQAAFNVGTFQSGAAGSHSHSFSGTTASTGGGGSHENLPPYYALAYIMKS
jgi:hypothetical protein